jgi:uncharacterized protein YaiI (UPF0178 family)
VPPLIYVDADACPVKAEVFKVAGRYGLRVVVVANQIQQIPKSPTIELVVVPGFGAVDDYIAETIGPGDLAVTSDVPLAARCVAKGAEVIDPKGRVLSAETIGEAVAVRDLMADLREAGAVTGGAGPMTPADRSRFLAALEGAVNRIKRRR